MLINILDVNLQKVAFLSNDVPGLPNYYDDEFHEYRDQGAATFKFTVKKVINNKLQSYARFLNGQSYFSFQIDGNDYLMTPASEQAIHETSEEISFFCVSLDRELMSEQANPLVNTSSHNIQWYFDQMGLISNTQITIGINEVSNLTRTINYDGQETKLARLISVIGNFDAEFEFITKLNNDGSLGSVTLNIYKENDGLDIQGVGKKRDDVRLIFGENIQAVERDVSTEGFLNATTVTGADNLNWNSASFSYINADGVEEFYKRAGSDTAFAPLSAKIYPAQLSKDKDDIWTRIDFTTEYKNVNDMWAYAVRQFKQYAYHQVTYTVTPSSKLVNAEIGDGPPLAKGDTVIIQDNNYIDIDGNVGLLLSARVSEKIVSETHPENNKLIFSNYKKLKSEVSTDIQAIVNQLVDAATPYRAELTTTNGTQFKNGTGSTTLAAHIFKGSATTETITDSYEWSKDGTVVANVQEITVDASGVSDKAVYSFKATVAGKVVASQSVTITNVDDGTNGRSVTNVSQKWRLTTTTATPTQAWSDAGWLTTQPTTTATNKYLWSITRTTFNLAPLTQDVIEQKAVYGDKGDKGDTGNDGRAGKDGVGINSTTITYAISSSGTVTPTAGWNSQVPTLVKGQYLWTKTVWNYSDGTSESGYTVSYIAKDGNNGHDGIAGKDGVGITATTITYAQSTSGTTAPSSGWTTSVPTVPAGQFLWTKTVWSYSDKTSETGYSVAMMGAKGDKGDQGVQGIQGVDGRQGIPGPKGADGKTQYTHIAYANSADGVTDFSTSDSNRAYIGMYVDFNINDSTTPSDYSWTLVKGADGTQGTPGKPGADGKTPYFHTAWSYSADGKDRFTTVYPNLNLLDGTRNFSGTWTNSSSWVTDGTYKGLTVKKRTGQWNGIYKTFTAPKDGIYTFSAYVKGSGIDSKIYRFLSVNGVVNGTVMPDTLIGNNFDWLRDSFTVTLKANDVVYAKYEIVGSGTDSILWTAGHKWEEGSTATPYMPSASEVTTADWPSYIGQYSDFTQADSTNPSDYTWSLIRGNDGKDGADGHDGIAGKDGTGIKTTTITYAVGTSGTTAPTGGWNSQVPNVPAGQYLWTKTVWDYTDKTSETGYSVSKFGEKGDKGDQGVQGIQGVDGRQGIPGPKGADGKTQYTHIAYANSADGVTDFSTSDSNRAYIGMYVDFNINDSTTPSDYSWTLVKGADGTQGTPGKPGADGKTPYFHTAWSYSADGKDRFTTVYPNLNLLDGTRNFSGTWTNSSSWVTDGTYKGLTVKKRTGQWNGIYKTFTAPKDGIYTFSAYVKGSGIDSKIYRFLSVNGVVNGTVMPDTLIGNNFDWLRDSFTVTLKANDVVYAKYEIVGSGTDSILWTAGHKWEEGSTATPYMPSASEVTTADWPSYIGQYSDFTQADSTNPSDYTWSLIRGNDGKDGDMGKSVWSYPYDRGANRLGSWWSDLKPTPTTDNPPKVGDTIIDLVGKIYQITNVVVDSTIGGGGLFDYGPMLTSIKGADGSPGKDGIAGKDGVGLKSTIITYGISASDSTMPGTWSQNTPALVKGQWFWTKTQWTYTDNSTETGYQKTYISKDGNNGHDGIAGKDGTGIKTTTITYAGSTSGTTAPNTGWTTTVPTVAAGNYLWTKTVWAYTDNTSETGYSVAMMGVKGDKGDQGPTGPAGSDGNPGKVIQQNTEPTNKFLDMLWQYTGTEPLNATGITVLSNIIYVWNGTAWQIWLLNPQNIQAVNAWITNAMIGNAAIKLANIDTATITELSAVTATLGDVEAGSITNDISYGFVAQGNHHYLGNSVINYRGINISETMTLDNVLQYTQSMGFDAITGLFFQRLSENKDIISSIRLIEVGNNEMGLYVGNATEFATLTSKGLALSTDVPWTILSPMGGFSGGSIQFSVQNGVEFFSIAGLSVPQMNANQWYQATSLPAGSIAIPSINRVYPISGNNNAWDLLINSAGGVFIRCQAAVSATSNLVNGGCGFPIG